MEEEGRKLCLVVVLLELGEETPLQVQVQLTEEMEDREALEAEVVMEEVEELVLQLRLLLIQQEMEVLVEVVAMEAAAEEEVAEGALRMVATILQE